MPPRKKRPYKGDLSQFVTDSIHKRVFPPGRRLTKNPKEGRYQETVRRAMNTFNEPLLKLVFARAARHVLERGAVPWKELADRIYDHGLHTHTRPKVLLGVVRAMGDAGLVRHEGTVRQGKSRRRVYLNPFFAGDPQNLESRKRAIGVTEKPPSRKKGDARQASVEELRKLGIWDTLKDSIGAGKKKTPVETVIGNVRLFQLYSRSLPKRESAGILLKSPWTVALHLEGYGPPESNRTLRPPGVTKGIYRGPPDFTPPPRS